MSEQTLSKLTTVEAAKVAKKVVLAAYSGGTSGKVTVDLDWYNEDGTYGGRVSVTVAEPGDLTDTLLASALAAKTWS